MAAERGVHPVEAMIDLGLESGFGVFFFQPTSNDDPGDVQRILDHPRTVMTFSDAGAHVSQIINASLPTHLLERVGARAAGVHARAGGQDVDARPVDGVGLRRPWARPRGIRRRSQRDRSRDRRRVPAASRT